MRGSAAAGSAPRGSGQSATQTPCEEHSLALSERRSRKKKQGLIGGHVAHKGHVTHKPAVMQQSQLPGGQGSQQGDTELCHCQLCAARVDG